MRSRLMMLVIGLAVPALASAHQMAEKNLTATQIPATGPAGSENEVIPEENLMGVDELSDDTFDTKLSILPLKKNEVRTFDIRGYKLGMSPREVRRQSRSAGFRSSPRPITSGDWDYEVTQRANQTLGRPIGDRSKALWRRGVGDDRYGNYISIETALTPDGPVVSSIWYEFLTEGQSHDQIVNALIEKYGEPCSRSQPSWGVCLPAGKQADPRYPNMTLAPSSYRYRLWLVSGSDEMTELNRKFNDAVEEKRAQTGRKAVF